jgi:hypothetical protein
MRLPYIVEDLNFKTKKQPSVKGLIAEIESVSVNLEPEVIRPQVEENGFDFCPKIEFENDDFQISLIFIPVIESKENITTKKPIGGGFSSKTTIGGGEEALKVSVFKKANRYGKFQIPYLICINALSIRTSEKEDIDNAIWGSLQYTYSRDFTELETVTRANNGLFNDYNKAKLTNVSGILVTKVFPSNVPNANYWLYQNPFARNSFDFEQLGLAYNQVIGNQITSLEGNDLDEVFEISKSWLSE